MSYKGVSRRVWVTWETQRRNQTASRALGATLFEIDYKTNKLMRYMRATVKTVRVLCTERPTLIVAQNPSIVLAILVLQFGRFSSVPVVIDAHNAGLRPFDGNKPWVSALAKYVIRSAALTIVSNAGLASYVTRHGGRPAVLPDPLPDLPCARVSPMILKGNVNVLFICTWASDEPYVEVIDAAALLDKSICVYVTGNSRGKESAYGKPLPENVVLTGYVHEQEYVELLHAVDVVVDLTRREDCLVCGAYEAVAVQKPVVLSSTNAIREYFSKGVLYTDNTATDIAAKIRECIDSLKDCQAEIKQLKQDIGLRWLHMQEGLRASLDQLERER